MIEICAAQIVQPLTDDMIRRGRALLPPSFSARALEKEGTRAQEERLFGLLLLWEMIRGGKTEKTLSHEDFQIAEAPGGKPYFPKMPHLQFSISHKGALVVCALCKGTPGTAAPAIGVDAEIIPADVGRCDAIAKRFFSQGEKNLFAEETDPCEAFARIWTRKESLLKVRGASIDRISAADTTQPGEDLTFSEYSATVSGMRYMISLCCDKTISCPENIKIHAF